jgi:adenine C2-methylase RlmN of 23S rRNA A2503 and tRNA A37
MTKIIHSSQDHSVNFIDPVDIGMLESRYVRRVDDYFIAYLSSQSGCDQACRMCHLTATGQNKLRDTTIAEFLEQSDKVFAHYDDLIKNNQAIQAKWMHYNFMARGEPLNNIHIRNKKDSGLLFQGLRENAESRDVNAQFLISSIIPESFKDVEFEDIFGIIHPKVYYSLYSMDQNFRHRWLNRALDPNLALEKLARWQDVSESKIKIHYAFIKDENDSEKDMLDICKALKSHGLNPEFNVVRYNPASERYGVESDEDTINRNVEIFKNEIKNVKIKIIPRVGLDVQASCGMFVK